MTRHDEPQTPRVDREVYRVSARDIGFEVVNPALARQLELELRGCRRIIDEMGVELRKLQEKPMQIENNTVEETIVLSENLPSFVTKCTIIPRKDGKGPLFVVDGDKAYARLDSYAIIPKELYEELRKAQERCTELEALLKEARPRIPILTITTNPPIKLPPDTLAERIDAAIKP